MVSGSFRLTYASSCCLCFSSSATAKFSLMTACVGTDALGVGQKGQYQKKKDSR